ncbi:MATE family efflux transporter [Coprobacillus sp. OF02-11LB]|uniref:MATE family efflux transporter n=1 Tax=Faecalibacillus intestinalis TaxID=1982626 RepID=UPI000E48F6DC|nr:MATE family efflux transporter [Faecalibacillus intestinalis]RGF87506.1 MATE family efflux transporter [Coprobacillus sp. OF02-11LB]
MKKLIGSKGFYKMVLAICIPIVIQNGFTNLASLLDNIMIGQLGTLSMSGVSITNQLLQVFNVTIFGAMSGPGIFMAQFYGKKNKEGVENCFRIKLIIGIIIALLAIFLFYTFGQQLISLYLNDNPTDSLKTLNYGMDYLKIMLIGLIPFVITQVYSSSLRETGNTVLPMIASVVAVIVNFCINYILIFGHFGFPQLGVTGAAIGTVVSRVVEMSINIVGGYRNTYLKEAMVLKKVPLSLTKEMLKRGLPLLCNEILWSISIALISQSYSTRGIIAVAAINITTTVTNFFMIVCYAIGNSISIVVGQQLGAGEIEKAKDYDLKMLFMNFVMCLAIGIVLFNVSSLIPQIYNTSLEVKALASQLLKIAACMLPIISIYYSSYFTMRAGGKTFLTFLFDSGYTFVFTFMSALLLTRLTSLPILTIYLLVQCVDIPKATLGLVLVRKGIWVHNIVSDL